MKQFFNPRTFKCLGKTLLWGAGNACYGLAPFIFVGFLDVVGINTTATRIAKKEFWHLINDGSLVFFFCALMGAIAWDLFFARKVFADQMAFVIVFIGSSVLVVLTVIVVYVVLLYTATNDHVFRDLPRFQVLVIAISGIFCILGKTALFLKQENI